MAGLLLSPLTDAVFGDDDPDGAVAHGSPAEGTEDPRPAATPKLVDRYPVQLVGRPSHRSTRGNDGRMNRFRPL